MNRGDNKNLGAAEADGRGISIPPGPSQPRTNPKGQQRFIPCYVADPKFSNLAERDRAMALHRICTWMAAAVQRGEPITRAVRRFSRKWNGKALRSAPGKRLRLAYSTLLRLWYRWRANPSVEVFHLHYKPGGIVKVTPSLRTEFRARCLAPGVSTIKSAYQGFDSIAVYESFCRALPRRERSMIRRIHRLRVAERKALQKLQAA
jgi:hypothetical protein